MGWLAFLTPLKVCETHSKDADSEVNVCQMSDQTLVSLQSLNLRTREELGNFAADSRGRESVDKSTAC